MAKTDKTVHMESQEVKERLSQNLKRYRKIKGWSQFELSEKAEVSEQTINSIEGLRLWPSDKTLAKISNALEIDVYRLFFPETFTVSQDLFDEFKKVTIKTVEGVATDVLQEWFRDKK